MEERDVERKEGTYIKACSSRKNKETRRKIV
jgi:hypothetical protein